MRGITSIVKVHSGMGTTPAMVDRRTGILYENVHVMERLGPNVQDLIRLHEEGHVVLQTTDETKADQYAFEKYAAQGKPLSESIKAFTRGLSFKYPEHEARLLQHLRRVYNYDYQVNGNQKAKIMKSFDSNYGPSYSRLEGDPPTTGDPSATIGAVAGAMGGGATAGDPTSAIFSQGAGLAGLNTEEMKAEALAKVKKNPASLLLGPFLSMGVLFETLFGGKKSQWSKMDQAAKAEYITACLKYSFENANPGISPKELFVELIKKAETVDSYDVWLGKNQDWVPGRIAAKEQQTNQKFDRPKTTQAGSPGRPGSQKINPDPAASRPGATSYSPPTTGIMGKMGATTKTQGYWYYASIALVGIALVLFTYAIIKKQ